MKIIHTGDLHLGSKIESKLPKEKAEERRIDLQLAFKKMLDFAESQGVKAVILAGDVFDSDRPFKKDRAFFLNAVNSHPDIDFLYLRGNHDNERNIETIPANLKLFSDNWVYYEYDDVCISGLEITSNNCISYYNNLQLDKNKKNIVVLHGQVDGGIGNGKINLNKLRNLGINYLALGHVHAYQEGKLDDKGVYVYCGCLEGRGFDETGSKGFVMLDTERLTYEFIENSIKKIIEYNIDISSATDRFSAVDIIKKSLVYNRNDIIRITLIGKVSYEIDFVKELAIELGSSFYFVDVKNKTQRQIDRSFLLSDNSIKGEFYRVVMNSDYTEDEKERVISLGLKVLSGDETD